MGIVVANPAPFQDQHLGGLMGDFKTTGNRIREVAVPDQVEKVKVCLVPSLLPVLLKPSEHHPA